MSQEYTFVARVNDGRLTLGLRALDQMRAVLKGWRNCPVTVTVEKRHATRSPAQNAWYFGQIIKRIADYTGYTPDELHEFFKKQFNARHVVIVNEAGQVVREDVIGASTTKLNKVAFGEYCEQIRRWAAENLGLDIPDPDPNWRQRDDDEEAA